MVLGFEIAANFWVTVPRSLFSREINRQQRLLPFHSMPKPQKSKWGNDIRNMHRNCVMQLPLLLCSSPLLLRSPLRDAASSPPLSSAALLSSISPLRDAASSPLSSAPLLSSISPLRDAASSPLSSAALLHLSTAWCSFLSSAALLHLSIAWCSFLSHLQLSSISALRDAASSPLSALHCVMQLPLLPSHLQISSPPPSLLLRCVMQLPLPSAALLHLSKVWCSFLSHPSLSSSALHCMMQLPLHISSPLHLSSSAHHCMMQLSSISLLLSPLSLSSPPPALHSSSSLFRFSSTRHRDWVPSANLPPKLYKRLIRHLTLKCRIDVRSTLIWVWWSLFLYLIWGENFL